MGKDNFSGPINFGNQEYIQKLLEDYRRDPSSVAQDWSAFFQGVDFANLNRDGLSSTAKTSSIGGGSDDLRIKVLVNSYRKYGHLMANTNPMLPPLQEPTELSLSTLGFDVSELTKPFPTLGLSRQTILPLESIIHRLRELYSSTISYETDHIESGEFRDWIHSRIASLSGEVDKEFYRHLILKLFKAKEFELFLQKKFLGAKRFSIEGGETFLPMMDELLNLAAWNKYKSCVIGMAHRGRLNLLCNLLNKPYSDLFREFEGSGLPTENEGLGDVKYHKGYEHEVMTRSLQAIQTVLAANPSHLESVDPVVLGITLAKQKQTGGVDSVLPILIHGDASVAGQGVVYETLQLLNIKGYSVGGCIHIVINNQIGFTAEPEETRSTRYCTDIAKAFSVPIIHVNAEDPVACIKAVVLAFEARHRFKTDVFIDLNCHRLFGHNESDEPRFTNPKLYQKIKEKDHIYKLFSTQLISKGVVLDQEVVQMEKEVEQELTKAFEEVSHREPPKNPHIIEELNEKSKRVTFQEVTTKISKEKFLRLAEKITYIPQEFMAHPKIRKLFESRYSELKGDLDHPVIDWASAELLAYASLVEEGFHVRLSGEDSKRGTFSHRHAAVVDQEKGELYIPLTKISPTQAPFEVYSSPLSEFAVMGFDYGYSLAYPKSLVIWEGQFGDFVNGAQIILDQYFSSSETKWGQTASLVLYLPHGYEGMGPEHTSCRIERFLQLAALDNMRIVIPSTPAQWFHLIRKQVLASPQKPLVIATPKSMLRLNSSFSTPREIIEGSFQYFMGDHQKAKRLLLCSGKIFHELAPKKGEAAIIRIEQVYPFHREKFLQILGPYRECKDVRFVQEEPANQGTWEYLRPIFREIFKEEVRYIGRPSSSVPDTGFARLFKIQQEEIIREATL